MDQETEIMNSVSESIDEIKENHSLSLDEMPKESYDIESCETGALTQENGKNVDILGGGDCVNFKVSDISNDSKTTYYPSAPDETEMQGDTNRDLSLEVLYGEACSNVTPSQDAELNKNFTLDINSKDEEGDPCIEIDHVLPSNENGLVENVSDERKSDCKSEELPLVNEISESAGNNGHQMCADTTSEKDVDPGVGDHKVEEEKEQKSPPENEENTTSKNACNTCEGEVEGEKPTDDNRANENQKTRSRAYPFKVLVSGLPVNTRVDEIIHYFTQFGEVFRVFREGRHKANVSFANEESVKKAVFYPDPYFDDHKLVIRSVNEVTSVIAGLPRNLNVKEAEKAVRNAFQEAEVPVCRVSVPMSEFKDTKEEKLIQGHAMVVFFDPQTQQKAEEKHEQNPFVIAETKVSFFNSLNNFYKKFCVHVFPLPSEQPRVVVYENLLSALSDCGEVVALVCQYVPAASAYAGTVLYGSEDSVKKALEKEDLKILDQFVEVREFQPFEGGQGFYHLWLKVLNLPPRVTITEVKHHFRHDKGILCVELDLDFGSCFVRVDSEQTIQRCLTMHQTYLRGKCMSVLIAEDNPGRNSTYYRGGGGRQNRNRQNYGNNRNAKKNMGGGSRGGGGGGGGGYNGMTFSSGQNSGNQERRVYERKERKYSMSRNSKSEPCQETSAPAKDGGRHVKVADNAAA